MNNKSVMNIEEVLVQIKKIKMYIKEENKLLEEMKVICDNISTSYSTPHQIKLKDYDKNIVEETEKIQSERKQALNKLSNYATTYQKLSSETKNIVNGLKGI